MQHMQRFMHCVFELNDSFIVGSSPSTSALSCQSYIHWFVLLLLLFTLLLLLTDTINALSTRFTLIGYIRSYH